VKKNEFSKENPQEQSGGQRSPRGPRRGLEAPKKKRKKAEEKRKEEEREERKKKLRKKSFSQYGPEGRPPN
jgi:hypothetical protein